MVMRPFVFLAPTLLLLAGGSITAADGLAADLYAGRNFEGGKLLSRTDAGINFNWRNGSPDPSVPTDYFSIRWLGFVTIPSTGDYTFHLKGDDGIRLWVDGVLVIDRWQVQGATEVATTPLRLEAGSRHHLRIEYFEKTGLASVELRWSAAGLPKQIIPASALTPSYAPVPAPASVAVTGITSASIPLQAVDADGDALSWRIVSAPTGGSATITSDGLLTYTPTANLGGSDRVVVEVTDGNHPVLLTVPITRTKVIGTPDGTGLAGAYFLGSALQGQPVLQRVDGPVAFKWAKGSPDALVPTDLFSARWTGWLVAPLTDDYTLIVRSDDGIRLWLDDALLIDQWTHHPTTEYTTVPVRLAAGERHRLRVEYFEARGYAEAHLLWSASATLRENIPATSLVPAFAPVIQPASLTQENLDSASVALAATDRDGDAVTWRLVSGPAVGTATLSPEGLLTYTTPVIQEGTDRVVVEASDGTFVTQTAIPITRVRTLRGTGTGLRGRYFAGTALTGTPVLERIDTAVDFNWRSTSPDALVPVDRFSVRWTGWISPVLTDDYTLIARTDDGVRLWIDDVLVINRWVNRSPADSLTSPIRLEAGRQYRVRMEYYENTGGASAQLLWSGTKIARTVVPTDVLIPNLAPVPRAIHLFGNEDAIANTTLAADDADSDALTWAIQEGPIHGTATCTIDGQLSYTPEPQWNGDDQVTVVVSDGRASATLVVPITITAVDDLPVPQALGLSTSEDMAVEALLAATDIDSSSLVWQVLRAPAHGSAAIVDGSTLRYVPASDWSGQDSLDVLVQDGSGSVIVTVPITVTAVNDAPVPEAVVVSTTEDTAVQVPLVATDVDGDTLTWRIVGAPAHGEATLTDGTTLTFAPEADWNGTDVVVVAVSDGQEERQVPVQITVTAVDDAPSLAVPAGVEERVGSDVVFAGTTVSDRDSTSLEVHIIATGGSVLVPHLGLTGEDVVWSGSPSEVQDALARLVFRFRADVPGAGLSIGISDGSTTATQSLPVALRPAAAATSLTRQDETLVDLTSYDSRRYALGHWWADAPGGGLTAVPNLDLDDESQGPGEAATLSFRCQVAEPGTWAVWALLDQNEARSDSVFVAANAGDSLLGDQVGSEPASRDNFVAVTTTNPWSCVSHLGRMATVTFATAGEHRVDLGIREDGTTIRALRLVPIGTTYGPEQAPIITRASVDGALVFSTDTVDVRASAAGFSWVSRNGAGLTAIPNLGLGYDTAREPTLSWYGYFPSAGTYAVAAFGSGPDTASDSIRVGLDGVPSPTADALSMAGTTPAWTVWQQDGNRATVNVPSAGLHRVDVWAREDGVQVSQVALSPLAGWKPTGSPLEALRDGVYKPNANGAVVLPARDAQTLVGGGAGTTWSLLPSGARQSLPDQGLFSVPTDSKNATMGWVVAFPAAGTYRAFFSGYGPNSDGDSIAISLDGQAAAAVPLTGVPVGTTTPGWGTYAPTGGAALITVPSAGLHRVVLHLREDGAVVDRLILQPTSLPTPSGSGPATSVKVDPGAANG